jgi:hypothetical protein
MDRLPTPPLRPPQVLHMLRDACDEVQRTLTRLWVPPAEVEHDDRLDFGSSGQVYRASRRGQREPVAIKILTQLPTVDDSASGLHFLLQSSDRMVAALRRELCVIAQAHGFHHVCRCARAASMQRRQAPGAPPAWAAAVAGTADAAAFMRWSSCRSATWRHRQQRARPRAHAAAGGCRSRPACWHLPAPTLSPVPPCSYDGITVKDRHPAIIMKLYEAGSLQAAIEKAGRRGMDADRALR